MEDLTEKITQILSDPEMMNNIKNISGLLGSSEKPQTDENECETSKKNEDSSGFSFSPEMMSIILKVMPIVSSLGSEDKYTRFLEALRPLLSDEKQKKLDNCSGILKIMRILPVLKSQGIL